jgi:hypothetical protein
MDQVQAREKDIMSDIMKPDQAARLLRGKAAELEAQVQYEIETYAVQGPLRPVTALAADIALIATLVAQHLEAHVLADHVERTMPLPKGH